MVNVQLKLLYPLTPTLLNDIIPHMLYNISDIACISHRNPHAMHYKNSGYTPMINNTLHDRYNHKYGILFSE